MARRYYGVNRGQTDFDVTEGSSTTSKDLEASADLAVSLTKSEFLQKLGEIKNTIIKGDWTPAALATAYIRWGLNRGQTEFDVRSASATYATLTLQTLVFTATVAGTVGNSTTIAFVDPAGNSQPLAVSVIGTAISVSLATGAGGAITTTRTLLAAAIAASAAASALVSVTGSGATAITAVAATALATGAQPVVTNDDVYVEAKLSAAMTKAEALNGIKSIENYVTKNNWTPA